MSTTTPREGVFERTATFTVVRAEGDDDGLTLEGYGAVFNQPTLINDWLGEFEEIIAPGAFAKTIRDKGSRGIRLQFDHGRHPLIGSIPLGVIEDLHEDARGLFVRARLTDNWLIQPIRDAIRDGAVQGMSFRFRVIREEIDADRDPELRTVKEVELFEVGPVVWPAYEQTTVGVRAQEIARSLMDPDQRAAVARALMSGTAEDAAPVGGTSEEAAERNDDAPPETGTRRTPKHAAQLLRRIEHKEPA